MKVVFSFDDGRIDSYDASKILAAHGLCGTFHITTGFIDGSFETDAFGIGRLPLSISMLREMASSGMEISSHGDKHVMETSDYLVSLQKINSFLDTRLDKLGFSIPNSRYDEDSLSKFVANLKDSIQYIRVGRSKSCYSPLNKIRYFLYHLLHFYPFFKSFNKHNVIRRVDVFRIYSLVIKSDTRVEHLLRFLKAYKDSDTTVVLMFHSITDAPSNPWEYKTDDFIKLCDFISSNEGIKTSTIKGLIDHEEDWNRG